MALDDADHTIQFAFKRVDDEQRRVVAWAYIARKADGTLPEDSGGTTTLNGEIIADATDRDVIDTPEALNALENAAYRFFGSGLATADDMHVDSDVAKIVGGLVFTPEVSKALGIPDGVMPTGVACVIDIPRTPRGDQLWGDIKSGNRKMLSVVGSVRREAVADAA